MPASISVPAPSQYLHSSQCLRSSQCLSPSQYLLHLSTCVHLSTLFISVPVHLSACVPSQCRVHSVPAFISVPIHPVLHSSLRPAFISVPAPLSACHLTTHIHSFHIICVYLLHISSISSLYLFWHEFTSSSISFHISIIWQNDESPSLSSQSS